MQDWPRWRFDQYLGLLVVCVMVVLQPLSTRLDSGSTTPNAQQLTLIRPQPIPVLAVEADQEVSALMARLGAEAVFVSDEDSGSVLLEKNAYQPLPPASTTKLMTALVARDQYFLGQVFTVGEEAFSAGNVMGLRVGEMISLENLLEGLLVTSGNDAAFVLANQYPTGYQGFVEKMNEQARQLGLAQSFFTNPSGLDDERHLMSARDLAIVFREVMKDEVLAKSVGTAREVISDVTGTIRHPLTATNELIATDATLIGGKTGTTLQAGEVLVSQFDRAGHDIVVVVMGSQDRYRDTQLIIDWVSANYVWQAADSPAELPPEI